MAHVKCDEPGCGWVQSLPTNEAIREWHRKPCPKCGKGEIVTDAELVLFDGLMAAQETALRLHPELADGPMVSVSSEFLRKMEERNG